jgi:hypothetical protein
MVLKLQLYIPKGLIRAEIVNGSGSVVLQIAAVFVNGIGAYYIPLRDQILNLGHVSDQVSIPVAVDFTRPDRLFVKLNPFLCDPAENHGPHSAIADGQGLLHPDGCGLPVPKPQIFAFSGLRPYHLGAENQ